MLFIIGKTLTIISLIIETINREKELKDEEEEVESDESESDEEDEKLKTKWAAKGRRDCKFANLYIKMYFNKKLNNSFFV